MHAELRAEFRLGAVLGLIILASLAVLAAAELAGLGAASRRALGSATAWLMFAASFVALHGEAGRRTTERS